MYPFGFIDGNLWGKPFCNTDFIELIIQSSINYWVSLPYSMHLHAAIWLQHQKQLLWKHCMSAVGDAPCVFEHKNWHLKNHNHQTSNQPIFQFPWVWLMSSISQWCLKEKRGLFEKDLKFCSKYLLNLLQTLLNINSLFV